jgi:RecB family endonuclease NucS
MTTPPFKMQFDIGTIKHLGVQMYSTLPPVIAELVSNAWDAESPQVEIVVPNEPVTGGTELTVTDYGTGMRDSDVRNAYLVIGRDRRKEENRQTTLNLNRPIIGRKGIGKFSAFGVANEIEIETVRDGQTSHFVMNYDKLAESAERREISLPPLEPTGTVAKGTRITLRQIRKYRNRAINIHQLRRGLARRFSIIGAEHNFEVIINGQPITPDERDLQLLLDVDSTGNKYLWEYKNVEIKAGTGWIVNGWIGAMRRTAAPTEGIQQGIAIMARGKLVQEPFFFNATTGQQYALAYLVGELSAEFVDGIEDGIGTTRNQLVWDTEANQALLEWGVKEINRVTREWSEKRKVDNETELAKNPLYLKFLQEAGKFDDSLIKKTADTLIRKVITSNLIEDTKAQEPVIQMCLDFMEFDAFTELADQLAGADLANVPKIVNLFREWEIVEAKEMMRVTRGRITTIEKLQRLIEENALEVPTLHQFLKEFPWVLDPRWTLIADEKTYSQLLREEYPEDNSTLEEDRRIDFLCVREGNNLVVVEIKRPKSRVSKKELAQIEDYVIFLREHVKKTTDPELRIDEVTGYLLCGDVVNTDYARGKRQNLQEAKIYVRRYSDLLEMVKKNHAEFLTRYDQLRKAKQDKTPVAAA